MTAADNALLLGIQKLVYPYCFSNTSANTSYERVFCFLNFIEKDTGSQYYQQLTEQVQKL